MQQSAQKNFIEYWQTQHMNKSIVCIGSWGQKKFKFVIFKTAINMLLQTIGGGHSSLRIYNTVFKKKTDGQDHPSQQFRQQNKVFPVHAVKTYRRIWV
jgi:hypothetical protein